MRRARKSCRFEKWERGAGADGPLVPRGAPSAELTVVFVFQIHTLIVERDFLAEMDAH